MTERAQQVMDAIWESRNNGGALGDIEPIKLIQMVVCLDILLGGDKELMRHWVNTHNKHLGYCPGAHLTDARMDDIIGYLEGMVEH
jgi:hypothetical protein